MAVAPMFIFMLALAVSVFLCCVIAQEGWDSIGPALAFAVGFLVIFNLACSWMFFLLFPSAFSSDGIYGHSFWGSRQFVSWRDVATARKLRLFNLRWMRIFATNGKVTWLPLFQSHSAEFWQEIRRLAPPESPILKCL
jgi:hypothetical protein